MTNMDHLEFWLSFVASNATAQEDEPPVKFPPVCLICTHADVPSGNQDAEDTSQKILAHLKRDPSGDHLVHDIYAIDNTVSGNGKEENENVKKLREDICMVAKHLPHMNEDIPIRWLKFERELTSLVENEQKRYISLEEAKNIASQCQVDIESDEFDTLLNYLHDLKIIIYFEDTNMVVIDIQWLLDMFVKVITVKPFLEWRLQPEFTKCWRRLEDEGILDRALVEHVWSALVDDQNTIDSLLLIMERFSLLCRWKCPDETQVFLVPAMLVNSDAKAADNLLSNQKLLPLVVRFNGAHLPLGIFPRLLVAVVEMCNKKWPNSRQPKFFHNFCRYVEKARPCGIRD
jgi:hypothetical protein